MSNKQQLVGNLNKGLTFIVSAPAGTGKSTLVDMLTEEFSSVVRSISCTTRPPRAGELNGIHYHFLSEAEFQKKEAEGQFLEHVTLFGYKYGTSRSFLEQQKAAGKHVVLVIDTQGALALMGMENAIFIFLMPPSFEELARRLIERGTESHDSVSKRLSEAEREIATASAYNYVIVNDEIETAYEVLRSIVIAEERRVT